MMLRLLVEQASGCACTVRGKGGLKVCMLVYVCSTRIESAGQRDHAPALIVVCTKTAMMLRLLEQACSCCTVRGEGELKEGVHARL